MACLRKRTTKNGFVYDLDFTVNGKRLIRTTKTSDKNIAKQILDDIQGKIARGKFRLEEYTKREIDLGSFYEKYFEYAEAFKKSTTLELEWIIARKFLDFVGNRAISSIDARLLDEWAAHSRSRIKPATFNLERRALHAMFNLAKKWKFLEENPFSHVGKLRVQERRRFMTDEEVDRLLQEIDRSIANAKYTHHKNVHQLYKSYVELLLDTGLRREEALKLRWDQVDLQNSRIYVQESKGNEMRTVYLTPRAQEILNKLGERLFEGLTRSTATHKFTEYCKRAGLTGFKLHSLRHTFATRLIEAGTDVLAVSKLLGHKDIRTTTIYAKATDNALKSAIEKLKIYKRE